MVMFLRGFFIILLTLPFFVLIHHFPTAIWPDTSELLNALIESLLQSLFSAALCVTLGFVSALGLLASQRFLKPLVLLFIAPSFLPPLFVMTPLFSILDPFPFGWIGIVLTQITIHVGLCGVLIFQILHSKIGGWSELALVEGASPWRFLVVVLRFLKTDLLWVAFYVFCICFSSLSVPLLAGKFRSSNFEVLIYEKIMIGEWGQVISMSLVQSIFLFMFGISLKSPHHKIVNERKNWGLLGNSFSILLPCTITIVLLFELSKSAWRGIESLSQLGWSILINPFWNSLLLGFGTATLTLLLFITLCVCLPSKWFERFLSSYATPSSALTAFAFFVLSDSWWSASLALTILSLPALYRLHMRSAIGGMKTQIEIAVTMGANPILILRWLILPRMASTLGLLAGLTFMWSVGDFAVVEVILEDSTLAILSKELINSYRLEAASFLVLVLTLIGMAGVLLFWRLGSVIGHWSAQKLW